MYIQIYDILRDSIFGVAELTTYQAFTLEQVSTILCMLVHLVPVVVPVWLLRRFFR